MPALNSLPNNKKFIYKHDTHSTNISQKLLNLYEKGKFFDTTLFAGQNETKIRAHSIVLTALSEYFSQKFSTTQSTTKNTVIKLKDIEASTVKLIIDFMYSGCIELNLENVENIIRTAAIFKLQNLFNACYEYIEKHINPANCWNWLRLAKEYNLTTLEMNIFEYCYANFQEVTKQDSLMSLNGNQIKIFLLGKKPRVDFEDIIFLTLLAWIEYDSEKRAHLTSKFLSLIRFEYLSPEAIIIDLLYMDC